MSSLPLADWLITDRGYDADWLRDALKDKGIRACILGRTSRQKPVKYNKRRYKRRNRIEVMFGRLKDWRRVATRYDRCPKVFLSAVAPAATVILWLCVLSLAFGLADPAQATQITGLKRMQAIVAQRFPAPPIVEVMQQWIHELGEGHITFLGDPHPRHLNPLGMIHGGWAMTRLDSALGCAVQTTLAPGETYA